MKHHHQKLLKKIFFIALLSQVTTLDVKALSIDTTSTSTMTWAKDKAFDFANTHTLYEGEFLRGNIKLNNGLWIEGSVELGITEKLDGHIFFNMKPGGPPADTYLILSKDLHLGRDIVFTGTGYDVIIQSGPSVSLVPGYGRATIHLNHPLCLKTGTRRSAHPGTNAGGFRFDDHLHIDGHGNKLFVDSSTGGKILLTLQDIYFSNIILSNFDSTYVFGLTTVTLDNVTLMVGSQISLYASSMNCRNNVKFYGSPETLIKLKGSSLTTKTESTTYFSPGCHIETEYTASLTSSFNWESKSSILYLDSCSIYFNPYPSSTVTPWKTGTLILNGKVDLTTSQTSYPLTIGTGSVADDLDIFYLPGSRLKLGNNIDLRIKNTN